MSIDIDTAPLYMKRNVFLLSACLAVSMTGSTLIIVVIGLTGLMLNPDGMLVTLPLTLQFVGTMAAIFPANILMRNIGRRAGFTIGQIIGIFGALICYQAVMDNNFDLFCFGGFTLGIHNAFWGFYRFAGAESASVEYKSRAISYVLAGGVVAAIIGPELATYSHDLFAPILFAGSYLMLVGLCCVTITILQFIKIPELSLDDKKDSGRPLLEIIKQPMAVIAIMAAVVGYASMSLIMTATPLAMKICGFDINNTSFVIQWHALGMFAPNFFTGHLIRKFGVRIIIFMGIICMFGAVAVNLSGVGLWQFWLALFLLGLGWNFMFVGGTNLLTDCYNKKEQNKVQSFNDFLMFGVVATASLSSGVLQQTIGWHAVNLAILLPIIMTVLVLGWYSFSKKHNKLA